MTKRTVVLMFVALSLVLSACSGASQSSVDSLATQVAKIPTQQPYPTALPTATPFDLAKLATMVAPTPVPPTATPVYTATIAALTSGTPVVVSTVVSTPVAGATQSVVTSGTMPAFVADASHGGWKIQGTDRLKDNPVVAGWMSRLKDPAPRLWKTFPNIPNKDVPDFRVVNTTEVPDGLEYGTYSSPYCFSHPCDIPVGAWEYRYISGDYQFLGTVCKGDGKMGCMLVLVNVGDQSFTWKNQDVDNGFTLRGRYWNGDALEWGVWGLVSHGSANMLNLPTLAHPGEVLNSGDPGNSGANCGTPAGCNSVDVTVVIHAGDAIIAVAKTTVTK